MLRAILKTMLAERGSVYDLVVAKGGPKFQRAETLVAAELRLKHPTGGMMRGTGTMAVDGPKTTQFYAIAIAALANTILSSLVDRPVVDKTGLTGYYDLALPSAALRPPPPLASQSLDAPSPPLEDDSIFTALQEALGLRLAPGKGRVETLVIDHVERPSEN